MAGLELLTIQSYKYVQRVSQTTRPACITEERFSLLTSNTIIRDKSRMGNVFKTL